MRPPVLCAGCPHTSSFMAVRAAGARVAGDIGCYTLACLDPLRGMDTTVSMGSSIGNAIGMAKAGETKPVIATIGDFDLPARRNPAAHQRRLQPGQHHRAAARQPHHGDDRRPAASRHRQDAARRGRAAGRLRSAGARDRRANGCARSTPTISPPCIRALRDAIDYRGVSVLIADRPCVLDPVKIKGPPFAGRRASSAMPARPA